MCLFNRFVKNKCTCLLNRFHDLKRCWLCKDIDFVLPLHDYNHNIHSSIACVQQQQRVHSSIAWMQQQQMHATNTSNTYMQRTQATSTCNTYMQQTQATSTCNTYMQQTQATSTCNTYILPLHAYNYNIHWDFIPWKDVAFVKTLTSFCLYKTSTCAYWFACWKRIHVLIQSICSLKTNTCAYCFACWKRIHVLSS